MHLRLLGSLLFIFCILAYFPGAAQERFNVRNPIDFEGVTFEGVVELENEYAVSCNGAIPSETNFPYAFARFTAEGEYIDKKLYSLETGFSVIISLGGLNYLNEDFQYVSIGQEQFSEQNDGFLVSFDEEGDTLQYLELISPYFEEFGSTFMAPVGICNSLNDDNSIFISTNISQPEAGSTGADFYIQRMAPEGEILWEYIYATDAQPEYCNSLLPTDNGGF